MLHNLKAPSRVSMWTEVIGLRSLAGLVSRGVLPESAPSHQLLFFAPSLRLAKAIAEEITRELGSDAMRTTRGRHFEAREG